MRSVSAVGLIYGRATLSCMADSDDDLSPRYPSLASILTNKQREYLLGQSDIEERTRSERAIRRRIRDRVAVAFADLWILSRHLEERDRVMVIETLQEEDELYLANSAMRGIGLIFELLLNPEAGYGTDHPSAERRLEMMVNSGVRQAFAQHGMSVENVDVDITVDRGATFGEFEDHDLEDVPRPVLEQMLLADEITSDEFVNALARMAEEEKENADE